MLRKCYGEYDRIIGDRIISTGIRFSIFNGFAVNDFVVFEPLHFCMFYFVCSVCFVVDHEWLRLLRLDYPFHQ